MRGLRGEKIGQMFKGTNLQQVVNRPQRANVQHGEYRQQYCIVINKIAKILEINYSSH